MKVFLFNSHGNFTEWNPWSICRYDLRSRSRTQIQTEKCIADSCSSKLNYSLIKAHTSKSAFAFLQGHTLKMIVFLALLHSYVLMRTLLKLYKAQDRQPVAQLYTSCSRISWQRSTAHRGRAFRSKAHHTPVLHCAF